MLRIDSHHHLWRYSPEEYGWIDDSMASLRKDFLLDGLRAELSVARVDGTVAVQARQTVEETDFLWACAEEDGSPVLGVVGWLPIADASFPALLDLYRTRLCGLRHVVQAEAPGFLDGSEFNDGIRAMRGSGLVYDILIYARQLEETVRFVDRHPEQMFVLDHIAKPEIRDGGLGTWAAGFRELATRDNVACKVSGMVTEADPANWTEAQLRPYFDVALDAFGPQRLMMGTDWPVLTVGCTYRQWLQTVEQWTAALSADEQAEIQGGTAQRVYSLALRD